MRPGTKNAKERHTTQYFEMFGNRAIYHEGWLARVVHQIPWQGKPLCALQDDVWELYNTEEDFSLSQEPLGGAPGETQEVTEYLQGRRRSRTTSFR